MLKIDRIEDFETIADEIDGSLNDLDDVAINLDNEIAANLVASIAEQIREKTASLALIFHELVGGETNDD